MTTKKLQNQGKKVIAKVKGTGTIYEDHSFGFEPNNPSGETLYNDVLAENKNGCVKTTDKSTVMRVMVDGKSADVRAALLRKTCELLGKMPGAEEFEVPSFNEKVGSTPHTKVYLNEGKAVMVTEIAFDEPNPKVAALVKNATAEQLKYIQQYMEPEAVFQQEVAQLCALLRSCKQKHAEMVSVVMKSNKKKRTKQ